MLKLKLLVFILGFFLANILFSSKVFASGDKIYGVGIATAGFASSSDIPPILDQTYHYDTDLSRFQYFSSKGQTVIRVAVDWRALQPTAYGPLSQQDVAGVRAMLDSANQAGVKVLIEPHNQGRYWGQDLGVDNQEMLADFWVKMATTFKGQPALWGYEIMNEPHSIKGGDGVWYHGSPQWIPIAQNTVNKIRTVDTTHTILVPGQCWSAAHVWDQCNPGLENVTDPYNNMLFSAHVYFNAENTGFYQGYDNDGGTPSIGVERLKVFTDWLGAHNRTGIISEFGWSTEDPRWTVTADNFLAAVDASPRIKGALSWSSGSWWPDNYYSLMEPRHGVESPLSVVFSRFYSHNATNLNPVFRFKQIGKENYFYTANIDEVHLLLSQSNFWKMEKVEFYAPVQPTPGYSPVYRVYWRDDPAIHFFTKSADELNYLIGAGWIYEGIGFYALDNPAANFAPVYHTVYTPYTFFHEFISSKAERDAKLASGNFSDAGIAWYGAIKPDMTTVPTPSPSPSPTATPSPSPTPSPTPVPVSNYFIENHPGQDVYMNAGQNVDIQALLKFKDLNYVVWDQSGLDYYWSVSDSSISTMNPYSQCNFGINAPCPLDKAYISGIKGGNSTITVTVKLKSNQSLMAQSVFNIHVSGNQSALVSTSVSPSPTPSISPSQAPQIQYYIENHPGSNLSGKINEIQNIQGLLKYKDSNYVVWDQSQFDYNWSINDSSLASIEPYSECNFGVNAPCPKDKAHIKPLKTGSAIITVEVKNKQTGTVVGQGAITINTSN